MAKLHVVVVVDKQRMVVATGPAPENPAGRKGEDGPIYAGFSLARGAEDFKAYEIEVDDKINLNRRDPDVDRFHSRLGELIRTKKDLKPVEFRR
jgi:hypothetical protein